MEFKSFVLTVCDRIPSAEDGLVYISSRYICCLLLKIPEEQSDRADTFQACIRHVL